MFLLKICLFFTRGKYLKQCKNNKLTQTRTWNAQFELPYSSYSVPDIQDYIACID